MPNDDDNKGATPKMLSEDEVAKIVADATAKAAADATESAKKQIEKLNEENKNRRLTQKEILEALNVTKEDGKTDVELIRESLTSQKTTIDQLQAALDNEKTEKANLTKRTQAEKIAAKYNFVDNDDVIAAIDKAGWSDDLEAQIKGIAETKKHWIKPVNAGGSYFGQGGEAPETLQSKHKDAIAKKDISSAIGLKLKMSGHLK